MAEIKDAQIRKIILSFMTLILFSIPVHWVSLLLWAHPTYSTTPFLGHHGISTILDSLVQYDPGMMMPNGGIVEFLLYVTFVALVVLLLALVANSLNMTGRWKINLGFSDQQISVLMLAMFVIGIYVERTWTWTYDYYEWSEPHLWSNLLSWDNGFIILALFPILMVVFLLRWIIQDKTPF
ncbi:MAG: hypothetical protein CMF55_00070 [Legionellales bacterium]|nr:hypothetical protein [Legionellales bacterium]